MPYERSCFGSFPVCFDFIFKRNVRGQRIQIRNLNKKKCNTEAKQNFTTHTDLSVEISDPKREIEDVIETFRNTTPAANQYLVQISEIEIPATGSHNRKTDNHIFSGYALLPPNVQESFTVQKAKMNKDCLIFKALICQLGTFGLRHFDAQSLRSLHNNQHKNERVPAKTRPLLTVYT